MTQPCSKNNTQIPRTQIMGVLNVTPDSFSDGGNYTSIENAVAHAKKLIADGANCIDIGGESTRPFAQPVPESEELRRTIGIVEAVRNAYPDIPISIDTTKAEVARQALMAGANIINDISACRTDRTMIDVLAATEAPIIIMHMQGTPDNMQINPHYDNVIEELLNFFHERIAFLSAAGIKRKRITIDPGIGFGKRLEHNLSLIKHLDRFAELNQPLLLAHSRKSFLGAITKRENEKERDFATAVVAACACSPHVTMVRVHNVAQTKEALQIAEAIHSAT